MPTDSAAGLFGEQLAVFARASVRDAELAQGADSERDRMAWITLVDTVLVEWGRNPSALEDEDFIPPNPDVINLACRVALECRDAGHPAPTRIVPDGEGGICFERVEGSISSSLRIYADQTGELLVFDDCHLAGRYPLP